MTVHKAIKEREGMNVDNAIKVMLNKIGNDFSLQRVLKDTKKINSIERDFNFKSFASSAQYCFEQFKRIKGLETEVIPFKADGKTIHHDTIMPIGWNADRGTLTITAPAAYREKIIADRQKIFNTLVCWSPPVAGLEGDVILHSDFKQGVSPKGKIVLYEPGVHPKNDKYALSQAGAIGVVCAPLKEWYRCLDDVHWVNAWADGPGWYSTASEKFIPCFSVSPNDILSLVKIYDTVGGLRLKMDIESEIKTTDLNIVTAVMKGSRYPEKEFIIFAHSNEPQPSDDAVGEAMVIECARVLSKLVNTGLIKPPECSIRFMVGTEHTALTVYFSKNEDKLANTIAGINLDTAAYDCERFNGLNTVRLSSSAAASAYDRLYLDVVKFAVQRHMPSLHYNIDSSHIHDDCFISDPYFNIPTYWMMSPSGRYWHNSNNDFSMLVPWKMQMSVERDLCFAYLVSTLDIKMADYLIQYAVSLDEQKDRKETDPAILTTRGIARLSNLRKHPVCSRYAGINMAITALKKHETPDSAEALKHILSLLPAKYRKSKPMRIYKGVLHSYALLPKKVRNTEMQFEIHAARFLHSYMDGKRTLAEVIHLYQHDDFGKELSNLEINRMVHDLEIMKRYNYIQM